VLSAGDAAGMINPRSGEGIYYALATVSNWGIRNRDTAIGVRWGGLPVVDGRLGRCNLNLPYTSDGKYDATKGMCPYSRSTDTPTGVSSDGLAHLDAGQVCEHGPAPGQQPSVPFVEPPGPGRSFWYPQADGAASGLGQRDEQLVMECLCRASAVVFR
jgi:hypothetical protein